VNVQILCLVYDTIHRVVAFKTIDCKIPPHTAMSAALNSDVTTPSQTKGRFVRQLVQQTFLLQQALVNCLCNTLTIRATIVFTLITP
jgi:hypothetical protein